ncbi:SRPBCC family protein [Azospirillum doebereinerae]|uniref:Coenzyme Q-binding protein COQ10 START domain-containing protein n=1 Tax=Azospirillum doebereinerae TaxID=92933 RepID=A0A3S0WWL2_9PROT|nr:SRPBCC family protein [Azospirillum doebereinerae]RUQ74091.1 hypothetical protein EJ913_06920 [Azospirillum doebereinerae]
MASNSLSASHRAAVGPALRASGRAGMAGRWAAMLGGTALGLLGARRGGWGGIALGAVGAGLFLAGATGGPLALPTVVLPAGILPRRRPHRTPERTQSVVTIAAPAEEVYRFWRNFANLPKLMPWLDRVDVLSATESQWIAKGTDGEPVRWRVALDRVDENELLTWHTAGETPLPHRASLMLKPAPGDRGTEVRLTLVHRHPPAEVARLLGLTPERQAHDALLRLKQRIETGELSTLDRQPHGNRGLGLNPASRLGGVE